MVYDSDSVHAFGRDLGMFECFLMDSGSKAAAGYTEA